MAMLPWFRAGRALAALALIGPAHAIQVCELDGQPVNPANGATTAGRSGLMRCRDADSGAVVREQELRDGRFMGLVRHFRHGQVEREFSVDERGNRSGLSREWNVDPGGARVLVREETSRDGQTVGIVRTWYPTGQRRRLGFHGDDGREQAVVEFTAAGSLAELRCGPRPLFGAEFDDAAACGHAGGVSTVLLYGSKGQVQTRIAYERGERRKVESLWESGAVRELRETTAAGFVERSFAADGVKLREQQWVTQPAREAQAGARPRSIKVLEQEFHTSGTLVRETRWVPDERAGAVPAGEKRWYLNGQPKELVEYADVDGGRTRREVRHHDNGAPSFEGRWRAGGGRSDRAERAVGTHRHFDEKGRVRLERVYDERGTIAREREFDAAGTLLRDDELFEDGSRKSSAR